MSLIKETEFWLQGLEDHGDASENHILRRIIIALRAGKALRDVRMAEAQGERWASDDEHILQLHPEIKHWDEVVK